MQTDLAFPPSLAEKYRPDRIADFIGLDRPKNGNAPDLARLAKESRNNVRDCLMRLEVELMAL